MIQKLLTVGSSKAVTVPKNALKELGLEHAEDVSVTIDSMNKKLIIEAVSISIDKKDDVLDWTKKFIEKYRPVLDALSQK